MKTHYPLAPKHGNNHHSDAIISAMASRITGVSVVCPTVCSGADQRKHQSSASLTFMRGIHRWRAKLPSQMASNAENVSIWWRHRDDEWNYTRLIFFPPDVALECFEKSKRGKPLLPLQSANTFKVIHNGSAGRGGGPAKPRRTSSISPIRSVQHSATAKTRTPKRPASDSPGRQANSLSPVKETKEVPPEAAVGTKIGTKTEKGKKSSAKGATPKATSISATKANSSNKHSAKTKAAAPPASTVSPYNSKIHIPQDNVKLKMSHNEIAGKQTKERKSPHQTEEDKEVPNRGS